MQEYQKLAIDRVREYARQFEAQNRRYIEKICGPLSVDARLLEQKLLHSPITINFHPDRIAGNGRVIIENLMEQGEYRGQFQTKTSNGGMTAFEGGDRFLWEQRLFFDAYPRQAKDRPKYGALNLFNYADGASVRFGSCFFTLKPKVLERTTFSYGDSSENPSVLCTANTFSGILAGLLKNVRENGRLLNQVVSSEQEALAMLLVPVTGSRRMGRNLDFCIEAHVHGDISLKEDVAGFYLDESFAGTDIEAQAEALCGRYGIELRRIPCRWLKTGAIGDLFRGPGIRPLAERVDSRFGENQGIVNAALIGQASRDSVRTPERWKDMGDASLLFQRFKQLWHTVGYFG